MARNRLFVPIITHGPNLFYLLLLAEYAVYFVFMRLAGVVNSVAAFEQLYRSDPTHFVQLARLTSSIAGTLTLIPTFLIGRHLYGKNTGLVAAVLLTFTFQHVRESHYGTPDVFVGLLVALALLFCVVLAQQGRTRDYVLSGALGGLATGTKFTNVLLWIPSIIAHFCAARRKTATNSKDPRTLLLSRNVLVAMISFGLAFVAAYPNTILRPAAFIEYVRFLISIGDSGFVTQFRIDPAPAWLYYPRSLVEWGMAFFMCLFSAFGLLVIAAKRRAIDLLLPTFVAISYVFLARAPYYASRYLVPLLPALCIFAGVGVDWLVTRLRRYLHIELAYVLIIGVSVLQPLAFSLRHDYLLTRTDTRTIAKEWIEANIAAGTKIALDWQKHAPPLRTMEDAFPTTDVQYDIMVADGIGLPRYSLADYRAAGVGYLIMSSFIDDQILSSPADVEARRAFHEMLDSSCELVYEVRPYAGANKPPFVFDQIFGPVTALWQFERPGPAIKIYRIP